MLTSACSLLLGIITARYLGPAERGVYTLVFATAGIAAIFLVAGLYQANLFFINQKKHAIADIVGNGFMWLIFASGLLLSVLLGTDYVQAYFGSHNPTTIALLIWGAAIFFAATELNNSWLLGHQLYRAYFIYTSLVGVLLLASAVPLLWVGGNASEIAAFRVIGTCLLLIGAFHVTKNRLSLGGLGVNMRLLKQQLKFGSKNVVQNGLGVLNYRVYLFFIAYYLDEASVGIFSVAMLFIEAARFLPNSVGAVLLPHISHMAKDKASTMLVARVCRTTFVLVLLVVLVAILCANLILEVIFGASYLTAAQPIYIMMVGTLMGAIYQILTRYFTSIGQQQKSIVSAAVALLVTIILSVFLIPVYEMTGAAIAFTVGQSIQGFMLTIFASYQSKIQFLRFFIPTQEDCREFHKVITRFYDRD